MKEKTGDRNDGAHALKRSRGTRPFEDSFKILSFGYDASRQTLEAQFANWAIFQYYGVPEDLYGELRNAKEKGRFLHKNIAPKYPCSRVG